MVNSDTSAINGKNSQTSQTSIDAVLPPRFFVSLCAASFVDT